VKEFYREQVFSKLPDLVTDLPIIEESVNSLLASLRLDLPDFTQKISAILTSRCTETLRQHIRSIITQYRQPNTKPPTEASYFVPHIIKPLATFCDVNKLILSDNRRNEWCYSVGDAVSSRSDALSVDDPATLMSDEDKIRLQILLDVKQFGTE
ncbi:2024_t:CDS:2, partial [Acaulospora morrowiae]